MRVAELRSLSLLVLLIVGAVVGLFLVSSDPEGSHIGSVDVAPPTRETEDRPAAVTSERPEIRPTLSRPRAFHTCIEGRVIGLPGEVFSMAWVSVSLDGESLQARLNAQGRFVIWNLPCDAPHSLSLGFGKGKPQIVLASDIVLRRNETRGLTLEFGKAYLVTGRIENATGEPLAGVRLTLVPGGVDWRDPGTEILAETDENGRYVIVRIAESHRPLLTFVIDGTPLGHHVEERVVRPAAGETHRCNVCLEDGLGFTGRVVGPDGKPVAGADVYFVEKTSREPEVDEPFAALGHVKTDARGFFTDDAYSAGLFRILVRGRFAGHPFLVVRENVAAGSEDLVIRFTGYGSLSLHFEDEKTGKAIPVGNGVLQRTFAHEGDSEEREDWKAFFGKSAVRLDHIPAGYYRVCLSHPGYEHVFGDHLEIKAGESAGPLVYKMKPGR